MENYFDKKLSYNDIMLRLAYFRDKKNLSARESSLQLGFSDSFMNRIERNTVELKVSTLLSFLEMVEISPMEFFYPNVENYNKDKVLLNEILSLSEENKKVILELSKRLK